MKIICNKNEFAEMVRNCYKSNSCYGCVLNGMCGNKDSVVAFTDVIEDEKDGKEE